MVVDLPFALRAPSELLDLAAAARARDAIDRGAFGAEGWGFAIANAVETELVPEGGHKVANLKIELDPVWGLARVLTLTDGWMRAPGHIEELFSANLYAVSGDGARHRYSFYSGPSGLALGAPIQWENGSPVARDAATDERIAAALYEALGRVDPTEVRVPASLVAKGRGRRRQSIDAAPFKLPLSDMAPWERACQRAREAVDAGAVGLAALTAMAPVLACLSALAPGAREARRKQLEPWLDGLWKEAFAYLEANVAAWEQGRGAPPPEVELFGLTICCPQGRALHDALGEGRLRDMAQRTLSLPKR